MRKDVWMLGLAMAAAGLARGDEPADSPRPIPLTRPEMKRLLEEMKDRTPRIPLPELTAEEKEKLGERGGGYEGRLRSLYMPWEGSRGGTPGRNGQGGAAGRGGQGQGAGPGGALAGFGFGRTNDPNMSLDYRFKTELFWIVSRANNCQYCLGHQEIKLAVAGMKEDELAALDGDWSAASPDHRAAYAFARKLTYEPHRLGDADIDRLREHFKDLQILEMILSVSGNNAINRWKEGVGVPQSRDLSGFASRSEAPPPAGAVLPDKTFLTPTSDAFKDKVSKVAALSADEATGAPSGRAVFKRPALESREEVEQALAACKARKARLPLVAEAEARSIASEAWPQEGPLPNWVRLLANFPREGVARIGAVRGSEEKGDLSPLLKAQVSWIIARQDRAWYALGQSKRRLEALGQTAEQVAALDGDWSGFAPADRALFNVARKLAASPVVLTDADVAEALKLAGPRDVVQLISYTTNRASFDRITEAAGLPLEE